MNENHQKNQSYLAEREGFEPSIPFWSIHAFQACALDRSATSPIHFRNLHLSVLQLKPSGSPNSCPIFSADAIQKQGLKNSLMILKAPQKL